MGPFHCNTLVRQNGSITSACQAALYCNTLVRQNGSITSACQAAFYCNTLVRQNGSITSACQAAFYCNTSVHQNGSITSACQAALYCNTLVRQNGSITSACQAALYCNTLVRQNGSITSACQAAFYCNNGSSATRAGKIKSTEVLNPWRTLPEWLHFTVMRAWVDVYREVTDQISRDPWKKCHQTCQKGLAKPSKLTKSHSQANIKLSIWPEVSYAPPIPRMRIRSYGISQFCVNPLAKTWCIILISATPRGYILFR